MKKKNIISIVFAVVVAISGLVNTMEVSAKTYGERAEDGRYVYAGSKTSGLYKHSIYKNTNNWKRYYPQKQVTTNIYHIKGHGNDNLEFSTSVSLSKTLTTSWGVNASISGSGGINIGIFKAGVDVGVSFGYGETYARGITYNIASSVSKTISSSANTGYYTRVPGYTFYKMRDSILKTNSTVTQYMIYYDAPYGSPVLFTIYSNDNINWSIY